MRRYIGRILAAVGFALAWAAPVVAETPSTLTVVIDDKYQPYIFRDESGDLKGILPDLWNLWSRKTGIPVHLEGLDWGDAQRRFNGGDGDVIDTIFITDARTRIYDFSEPYATIEVALFFSAELSGITDAATARGFAVGVKDGDACIDYLADRGVSSFHRYGSYDTLIDAAGRGEVKVFCVDKPPAIYLLVKKNLLDRFRATPPLYSGQFHWAVRKGRDDLRRLVASGFSSITQAERQAIEERWLGRTLGLADLQQMARMALPGLSVVAAIALALVAWVWALRRQVGAKTRQLRQTLDELAVSERRFRAIFDSINDAIFIHDADSGAILMVNRRAREMYGWEADELPRLSVGDISEGNPPYSMAEAKAWMDKAAAEPQIFEWRGRHKDGHLFWCEVGMRHAVIDGEAARVLVMVRNIDERKEAADHLARTVDALTSSNADLERYAYAASHDLREPLNTVVRYSQLLRSRYLGRLDADADDFIGFVEGGAKQMMRLIEGLLEISRVHGQEDRFGDVDPGKALSAALSNLDELVQACGATVAAEPLPPVRGNETQLTQLFQNLIGNAIKYRAVERPLNIRISCRRDGDQVEFSVADNGIGIDPDYLEHIFVIFKRLHTQQAIPGIGLGLALCRRIVERHGGRIWAESTAGAGTVFTFTLPAAEDQI